MDSLRAQPPLGDYRDLLLTFEFRACADDTLYPGRRAKPG
jgi:hypothetical protein